jgi:hypothetical protein
MVQLPPTLTWVLFVFTGTHVGLILPTETSFSIKIDLNLAVSLHRPYHHQLPLGLGSAITAVAAVVDKTSI